VTASARRSGDIIRKASKATVVLQCFAVLLLLGLIYLFTDISSKYSMLQDGVRENALWSVYQLDREARRLHETLHLVLAEKDFSPMRIKALGTRYDILYSRMTILEDTSFEKSFSLDEIISSKIADTRKIVFSNSSFFDRLPEGGMDETALNAIDQDIERLLRATEALLSYSNNKVSTERADARDMVLSLQSKSAVLVALLVGCVVFLIVTLRRQLRSVRVAGLTLEAVSNKLEKAYLDAEAGNRAKSQFMATIGHEIRTPLNAILGTAELLQLSHLPQTIAPGVQTIRRSGQALLEIINEILDFSKIEHGKLDVENRAVDVQALVAATVDIIRDRATEQGNHIILEMPDTLLRPVIATDPTRLRQVLLNLLSNAVKFTSEGAVTLRITELAAVEPAVLRFEVTDTGIGIDQAGLSKLFQPFSQVDASISRKYGGTGLGLTICKQIVEALHGNIGVESSKDEGSTFWFEIPAIATQLQSEPISAHSLDGVELLPQLEILLVEDNLLNQQVAAGFLAHLGQKVTIANDGIEAAAIAGDRVFDVILMDMQMPRLDGIEATKQIRASEGYCRNVPIIAMTANASDDDRRRCKAAGMTGFEAKPITTQQLRRIIRSFERSSEAPVGGYQLDPVTDAYESRRAEIVEVLGEVAFEELLSSFFDDAALLLGELHSALEGNDYRSTDRLLHTLKGAASSIGLLDVADCTQTLRQESLSQGALVELQATVTEHKKRLAA
jgi:signal transduction histidine kinase/DNA-binding response OmpR family regulator